MMKVLKTRRYKVGYEVRDTLYTGEDAHGGPDIIIKMVYNHNGQYIGNSSTARYLCKEKGIAPEYIDAASRVCSIGFCEKEQKWFGWSHRAIFGFGIGDTVKSGDCGFTPGNVIELFASLSKDERKRVAYVDADKLSIKNNLRGDWYEVYDINVGRGEWTAQTLDDAKQMAIDFARSVS